MKIIFSILFIVLFLNGLKAQNCLELIHELDDEDFENVTPIMVSSGENQFEIHLLASRKSLFMNFKVEGAGKCIDDNDEMTVIFTDDSGLKMTNDNKFNCDQVYTQHFGEEFGKKKEFRKFLEKEINSISITTVDGNVELTFPAAEANEFKQVLNCLAAKMKFR